MTLGWKGIKAIEQRSVDVETAVRCGLHTIRWDDETQTALPDEDGNVIAFPFFEHGRSVAEKYRGPQKTFWQRKGGRKTFWNADVLDDERLYDANDKQALIITEGEWDALSAISAGFATTVSVPDGAPPPAPGAAPVNKDDPDDQQGKFEFLWNNRDRLRKIRRFVIAVDNDPPGQRLEDELVRRLSPARCFFVRYPEGCKDLNDVLRSHGSEAVCKTINDAKPYPVHGLYRLSDYPDKSGLEVYPTGWPAMDKHFKMVLGEFVVISGIPNHGKTIWTFNLIVQMAKWHGWASVIFSGEMAVMPQLRDRLCRITGGQNPSTFINNNFFFIDADPGGNSEEPDFTLEWLIERATDAVIRYGIRIFLIDPWNEVEHSRDFRENGSDYVGRSIRALKSFARQYQVVVIVIAHPTKEVGREGKMRTPTLYDIESSAHWANKADHGIIIERPNMDELSNVHIVKSRFDEAGERGSVQMLFDRSNYTFSALAGTAD